MPNKIYEFYLSHHFMLQGWDRSIDAKILKTILPDVKVSKEEKSIVVVTPSFLREKGITSKAKNCLVIVLRHKLIKTGFWSEQPDYLINKERKAHFQLLCS